MPSTDDMTSNAANSGVKDADVEVSFAASALAGMGAKPAGEDKTDGTTDKDKTDGKTDRTTGDDSNKVPPLGTNANDETTPAGIPVTEENLKTNATNDNIPEYPTDDPNQKDDNNSNNNNNNDKVDLNWAPEGFVWHTNKRGKPVLKKDRAIRKVNQEPEPEDDGIDDMASWDSNDAIGAQIKRQRSKKEITKKKKVKVVKPPEAKAAKAVAQKKEITKKKKPQSFAEKNKAAREAKAAKAAAQKKKSSSDDDDDDFVDNGASDDDNEDAVRTKKGTPKKCATRKEHPTNKKDAPTNPDRAGGQANQERITGKRPVTLSQTNDTSVRKKLKTVVNWYDVLNKQSTPFGRSDDYSKEKNGVTGAYREQQSWPINAHGVCCYTEQGPNASGDVAGGKWLDIPEFRFLMPSQQACNEMRVALGLDGEKGKPIRFRFTSDKEAYQNWFKLESNKAKSAAAKREREAMEQTAKKRAKSVKAEKVQSELKRGPKRGGKGII